MTSRLELGIFAKVFGPAAPRMVADAVSDAGFATAAVNLSAFGRPTLDSSLTANEARSIASDFRAAGVGVWGLSGTFNAIDPDEARRAATTADCVALIRHAPDLGAEVVTLCTGTRDATDMWRPHPDNVTRAAWRDLRATLDTLLMAASDAGVLLGIEPEPGNVVADEHAARRLLAELGADAEHVGIVLDPANLLTVQTLPAQRRVLGDAFAELGAKTIAVHAKDVVASGYAAAGTGGMDYDLVMRLHAGLPQDVPVIAQDLRADDAPRVVRFLRAAHARAIS